MGKNASKLKTITRPVKNFNVEERAFKAITKEKKAAPPYPNMEQIMRDIKNDPELLNRGKRSPEEVKIMNQVYITSEGRNPIIRTRQHTAPHLPESRTTPDESVYGVEEPLTIRPGRLSLRQVVELMEKHQKDKEINTAEALAKEYQLDIPVTSNMLKHFVPFQVYTPPRSDEEVGTIEKFKRIVKKEFIPPKIDSK